MDREMIEQSAYLAWFNLIRKEKFRPCVIAALVYDGMIGMCGSRKYPGYEFPQGGIEPDELPLETIEREIREELGVKFAKECNFPPKRVQYLFDVRSEMKVKSKVQIDTGETIRPKGKHYIVFAVDLRSEEGERPPVIDTKEEGIQYHRCVWANAETARKLAKGINAETKRKIVTRVIDELETRGFTYSKPSLENSNALSLN